jgi:hypothetical protein
MAEVSFEDLEVGKTYLITYLDHRTRQIQINYQGVPLKDIPGVIVSKETLGPDKIVEFSSEKMNTLANGVEGSIYSTFSDITIFKEIPRLLTNAINAESLARQKGVPAAVGLNIASFLNPSFSKSSPENVAAETKFGHENVPPGHYTKTAVDKAFSGGKRRKTRKSRKTRKTKKSRTRHH